MKQKGDGFVGYRDWRLPSIDELKTLVYCSTGKREYFDKNGFGGKCLGDFQQPTIDLQAFPNTPEDGFWSSSPYANGSNYAWNVYFDNGYVGWYGRGNDNQVRLVRAGQ